MAAAAAGLGRGANLYSYVPNKEKDEGMLANPFVLHQVTNVGILIGHLENHDSTHFLHFFAQPNRIQFQRIVGGYDAHDGLRTRKFSAREEPSHGLGHNPAKETK